MAMADFLMPALGADMETGRVVQWRVQPGDRVRRGDVVAVVETHKGAIDVEIFFDGVIDDLAPQDVELPVGALLAHVRVAGEALPSEPAAAAVPPPPPPVAVAPPAAPMAAGRASTAGVRRKVSPAAWRRALALGVDVGGLQGSGVGGAVTLADVERAASGPAAARAAVPPAVVAAMPPRRGFDPAQMRLAIASAMARSKREIPHYYLGESIPMRAALEWLRERNAALPVTERLLPAVLLLKAVALALRAAPQLNGHFVDGCLRPSSAVHVGVAISLRGGGLVAPALHDVQDRPLPRLMSELGDLVQRARAGGIRSSEMTDPTITVTHLGDTGVESVFGVIYPPQVALVGFGRVSDRAWVGPDGVEAMPVVHASLAADHRASDGHVGAVFLRALAEHLQRPESL